jgi:hypothetical protein
MMVPIWLRSFADALLYRERQEDRLTADGRIETPAGPRFEPPAHDLTTLGWPTSLALPSRPRAIEDLAPLVTVHVTDVAGGFGVSKGQLKAAGDYETALLRRYHGCAYHRLVSRRVGLVTNHPLTLRTSHGNGGNRGAGWAIDCGHKEALSAGFVAAAIDSLEDLILDVHEVTGETVVVVPHCVFSKKRKADTSATVWSSIVVPAVERVLRDWGPSVVRIGYDVVEGGYPIPADWGPRVGQVG